MPDRPNLPAVQSYLLDLQDRICSAIEAEDGTGRFHEDSWERPEGGGGRSRVLSEGAVFEQAGLPRHPLERHGFTSVGCMPCSSARASGEDVRA